MNYPFPVRTVPLGVPQAVVSSSPDFYTETLSFVCDTCLCVSLSSLFFFFFFLFPELFLHFFETFPVIVLSGLDCDLSPHFVPFPHPDRKVSLLNLLRISLQIKSRKVHTDTGTIRQSFVSTPLDRCWTVLSLWTQLVIRQRWVFSVLQSVVEGCLSRLTSTFHTTSTHSYAPNITSWLSEKVLWVLDVLSKFVDFPTDLELLRVYVRRMQ